MMTEHLKMVRENAYFKVCIINLIEAIQDVKELRDIKNYLKDVIDGVEPNTHKENADKIADIFKNKVELYNEVVRLREILKKINHVMNNQMDYREFVDIVNAIDDILKQNNLTLEQLTGVDNA